MDFGVALAFILIFILILAILVGIAYYVVKSSRYPDPSTDSNTNSDVKPISKKQQNRQKPTINGKVKPKAPALKRKERSRTESESSGGIEEDPIVIIPDPFTLQLTSRFAGAISAAKPHHHQNGNLVQRKPPTSSNVLTKQEPSSDSKPISLITVSTVSNQSSSNNVPVNVIARKYTPPPQSLGSHSAGQVSVPNEQSQRIELKTKPKATVKPNLTSPQHDQEAQQPKLIKVNVVNSKYLTQPMDLLHKNYESQIEELNHKVRELNESVVDKLKKLDQSTKLNTELKLEITKFQTVNKRLETDLETLRQSNQVIQKELTKSTQRCVVYEKEKALMQEKFRLEFEALKKETVPTSLYVADPSSDQSRQNFEAQITYLKNEISQIQKSQKDKESSFANKMIEISSEIAQKEGLLLKAQTEKKSYEIELGNLNEKNIKLFQSLQTQEALTKQLEIQLEKSIPSTQYEAQIKLIKQRENELNQMKADNQQLCKTVEELKKMINDKSNETDSHVRTIHSLEEKNLEMIKQIESLKSDVFKVESKLVGEASSSYEQREADLNAKTEEIGRLKQSQTEIQEQNNALKIESEEYRTTIDKLNANINDFNERVNQLTANLEEQQKRLEEAQKNENEIQKINTKKDEELNDLKIKIENLTNNLRNLEEMKGSSDMQVNEIRSRCEDLERKLTEKEHDLTQQSNLILQKEEQIKDLKYKLELIGNDVKNESKHALEEIEKKLGEKEARISELENNLAEICRQKDQEINDLRAHIEHLLNSQKDLENNKNSFLEQIEHKQNEINDLKSRLESISNGQQDLEQRKQNLEKEIQEQKQKADELNATVERLSREKDEELRQRENEINDLKSRIENVAHHQNELEQQKQATEKQLNESQSRFEELERRLNEINQTIERQEREINEKNTTLSHKDNRINELDNELDEVKKNVRNLEGLNNELKSKSETLENRLGEIERNNNHEDLAKLKELIEENEMLKLKNVNMKLALEQTEKQISQFENVILSKESTLDSDIRKMSNGNANGNGDINGKHENGDKESERLKKENMLLRKLLEDERKLNKETQREKDRIKDLLKLGHEALEHERLALQEKLDEKQLQKEQEKMTNANGNSKVDAHDQQSATTTAQLF